MVVKVKRERPDQRRHHRVTAPLYVAIDGHRLKATNWSLSGFRLDDFPGDLPPVGGEVGVHLTLPFQGFDVSYDAKVAVVRNDPATRMFGAKFTELGERERELMNHFIEELIRGSMAEVQDTIQRIDVPVTPASLEPTKPASSANLPIRRMPVKAIMMTGIYGVLGVVIFAYTALLGYSNFYRMEVQTAVVTAPIETVTAVSDGKVTWAGPKPGDPVKTGEIVLEVIDNQLEREIELADIAIKERKAQLLFLKRRQSDELARMKSFNTVEVKNLDQAKIEVENVRAQVNAADYQYGRLAVLHRKGFTTDALLEQAEKLAVTLRKTLESKQVEFKAQIDIANQSDGRYHYTGQTMVGELAQIEAQAKLAENEVQLTEQKYQALLHHKDRLAVRAPFDGTILELPHVDQGTVKRGDIIAVVEQRRERQVTAYLNQDEIVRIGLGDEALLYIPGLNETLKGRVTEVDRTSGFVREQNIAQVPGYRWRGPVDRSAKVTVQFLDATKVRDSDRYRSGLPVVVVFPQRSTNSLLSALRQKFATFM